MNVLGFPKNRFLSEEIAITPPHQNYFQCSASIYFDFTRPSTVENNSTKSNSNPVISSKIDDYFAYRYDYIGVAESLCKEEGDLNII